MKSLDIAGIFILVSLAAALSSCREPVTQLDDKLMFYYCSRNCDAVTAWNYKRVAYDYTDGYHFSRLWDDAVSASDYMLRIDVGPHNLKSDNRYGDDELNAPDKEIEKIIDEYLKGSSSGYVKTRANSVGVEYRTEELEGITVYRITGDNEAEAIPKEKTIITGAAQYQWFIISADKRLVGDFNNEMPVNTYLTMRPLMASTLYLRFNGLDGLAGQTARFAVEIDMKNGKILRDTTNTVTLK